MLRPADRICSVVICDDSASIRRALHFVLAAESRIEVVGEASNGLEAIDAARTARPDVLLLDVSMPLMDGIEALPHILSASPCTRILMMTALPSPETKARALEAGATDYVVKDTGIPDLIQHILRCAAVP
ncbi:MAG TPA: response regulator [Gemmatimonadaceae bacterium]|nr:response regulator [Gemmatimonadaceae bacterium]